jgi:diguanylate cyclase (GGDEF)-like protein
VRVVAQASDGVLWVGTESGLDRFHSESGTFSHVTASNGRGFGSVLGILEDRDGFLWVSTGNGLYRVDRATTETFRFDENEGLQANEFHQGAYLRNSRGELVFGGVNGFSVFQPGEVQPRSYQPPILLTRFKVFDRDRALPRLEPGGSSGIRISHRENFFSFEFSALDYVAPERVQYAYRMEGFDQDWIDSGNRRYASYTNLDPGSYIFRVKATNSDGLWNEDELEVAVTITPPFWQTWWFRMLGVIVVLGAVFGTYRLRVRHLEERERTLSRLLDERTRHLTEREQELEEALRERNQAYREVERLARTDPLTGLWNRRAILERLEDEKRRSDRSKVPFAVIMADIDDFKAFNDHYGHKVGDAVLVHVSKLIKGAVRKLDTVGRWGGEEIVLLLPGTAVQGGMRTAHMLRKKVAKSSLEMEGRVFSVRMTFGVTSYQPPMTTQQCIQLADEAMLKGKKLGKDTVTGKRFGFAAST